MVYYYLGRRYPKKIQIKTRMVTYWSKLINGRDKIYVRLFHYFGFKGQQEKKGTLVALENFKNILNHSERSNIWQEPTTH